MSRTCTGCKQDKSADNFYKKQGKYYNQPCKACQLEKRIKKRIRTDDKDEIRLLNLINRAKTPPCTLDLCKKTGYSYHNVNKICQTLVDKNLILIKKINLDKGGAKYVYTKATAKNLKENAINKKGAKKQIDLGLSVLCSIAKYGETLSFEEIADICGCNKSYIQSLSSSALYKLKRNLEMIEYAN